VSMSGAPAAPAADLRPEGPGWAFESETVVGIASTID
jgi:hypothetical protein